jgi:AbrB family looped-hinge helix DNA binding protein
VISHGPAALPTTRLSTKGHVTLPKSIREAEALKPGAEFIIERTPKGILLRPVKTAPSRIEDVSGCLRYRGKPKSVAEMDRAIAIQI